MSGIVLSSAVRSSLITLQKTADLQGKVQERLSTGKKVNSALDNPTNFFTAAGLGRRANDLSALLDGMSQGIKTLEAADNAMKAITKTVETMQANIRQARQDKSFKGVSYTIAGSTTGNLSFSGGAVGTSPVTIAIPPGTGAVASSVTAVGGTNLTGDPDLSALNGQSVTLTSTTGQTTTYSFTNAANGQAAALETALEANGFTVTRAAAGLNISRADGIEFTVDTSNAAVATAIGIPDNTTTTNGTEATPALDSLVNTINADNGLKDKIKASNDGGKLRIENLSTEALTVVGASATAVTGGTGGANTQTIGGNDVRKNLITQFNDLRKQLDKLASDGSYNGINLVKADKLKITFNEFGTSSIEIQAKDVAGTVRGIGTETSSLNIGLDDATEFSTDASLDTRLDRLNDAVTTLQTQSSSFGAALTTVQNRQEFTKAMIITLQQGADGLTLADSNEERANLLALNTRQQLSQTALSLASQASQAVLLLF